MGLLIPSFSFQQTRSGLILLNGMYMAVGILLICTGAYARNSSIVTSVSVVGGLIAAGVFLFCVAALGIYGTRRQHQAALFFYMLILFLVFVVQLSVAAACLGAVSETSLAELVEVGWKRSSPATIFDAEKAFGCCGLHNVTEGGLNCQKLECFAVGCSPCMSAIVDMTHDNLTRVGSIGLFFSFTELLGIVLAYRFRNMKDPRFNPHSLFH